MWTESITDYNGSRSRESGPRLVGALFFGRDNSRGGRGSGSGLGRVLGPMWQGVWGSVGMVGMGMGMGLKVCVIF